MTTEPRRAPPDESDAAPEAAPEAAPDAVLVAGPAEESATPRVGVRRGHLLAALAALGVVTVLALGPAAALAASRLPLPASHLPLATSTSRLQLPQGPIEQESGIREVPVGLPEGARIRSVDDVRPYAVEALGPDRADRLLAFLPSPEAEADREPLQPNAPAWSVPSGSWVPCSSWASASCEPIRELAGG